MPQVSGSALALPNPSEKVDLKDHDFLRDTESSAVNTVENSHETEFDRMVAEIPDGGMRAWIVVLGVYAIVPNQL